MKFAFCEAPRGRDHGKYQNLVTRRVRLSRWVIDIVADYFASDVGYLDGGHLLAFMPADTQPTNARAARLRAWNRDLSMNGQYRDL